ncbi:MAG: hypothetical protein OXI96_03605 [Acidimicrobiaceae bacterium]|nr:hypothetical protein [Acidimicrobiaceae bacterium]
MTAFSMRVGIKAQLDGVSPANGELNHQIDALNGEIAKSRGCLWHDLDSHLRRGRAGSSRDTS